jgi:hypothetical protein
MQYKVGRFTLALALIVLGAALVYDNLVHTSIAWSLFRLWPALLIGLGLEWIVASAQGPYTSTDGGAIAFLIVGALVLAVLSSAWATVERVGPIIRTPAAIAVFGGGYISDQVTSTYSMETEGLEEVVITGGQASVTVESGDTATLTLRVRARGSSQSEADENARMAKLILEEGASSQVALDLPNGVSYESLSIYVVLPASVKLRVRTGSGSMEVVDRAGDVTLSSSSGTLRAERITGSVDLRASSGSIVAREIGGDLSAITSSGSIAIERVEGNVEASATSGSITIDQAGGKVAAHTTSGSVTVNTATVGGLYDLGAVSGTIGLALPESAAVSVDARTSSGSVRGPAWLTLGEGRGSAHGTQGDGTYPVILRTSSGSIFITNR